MNPIYGLRWSDFCAVFRKQSWESPAPMLVMYESPYAGDVEANLEYARRRCREILEIFPYFVIVAPHLYYPTILNDDDPSERERGLRACHTLRQVCGIVLFDVHNPGRPGYSSGMQRALQECGNVHIVCELPENLK